MTHPEKNAHAALCDKNRVIKARKSASLPQRWAAPGTILPSSPRPTQEDTHPGTSFLPSPVN
jgi:hypothetical protein